MVTCELSVDVLGADRIMGMFTSQRILPGTVSRSQFSFYPISTTAQGSNVTSSYYVLDIQATGLFRQILR